jgi:2-dehydro-3-deoxy-D-pentonate aldolase
MTTRRFHGIVPPVVTPLTDRDTLDVAGLERLIEHMIEGGVHGLFILGTTGEAPSLSYRLRREMIQLACQLTRNRVPVLVGITDTAFIESVALAKYAAESGADALVLTTPYYFPAGQTELMSYVEHLIPELPLPVMLYNIPSLTKVWFEVETLKKLTRIQQIVGIKDSSGDLEYYAKLVGLRDHRPDWSIMVGQEALLSKAIHLGGNGAVAGGANVFPKLFVDCYNATVAGEMDRIEKLNQLIQEFQPIYDIGKYASRFIKATKCSLSVLDICDDFMAEPFHRFNPPERERVKQIIESIKKKI